ncbi:MAG: Hsp20/alpha crystallin family protein [Alphaproteobacteria bacterium]|nr:Hsp20/alpha crystallin family protein [Alphaproteobacteria bacterium]
MSINLTPISRRTLVADPFHSLREEIDRIFDKNHDLPGISPELEVLETPKGLKLTAELPGLKEEDIDVTLVEGILTLRGEKKSEKTTEDQTYHMTERKYGSFLRSIKLPYTPKQEDVTASLEDGILTLVIPRPETVNPNVHKIPILYTNNKRDKKENNSKEA